MRKNGPRMETRDIAATLIGLEAGLGIGLLAFGTTFLAPMALGIVGAVVGLGNAKELIMTGKVIDGREAHRIGFANRVAPAAELDAVTETLANELLACAPRAVGLAKRVMDAAAKPALALTLEQEVAAQETLAASEDFAEGARAFFEKRDPGFVGR